jgi:hypothetical protein
MINEHSWVFVNGEIGRAPTSLGRKPQHLDHGANLVASWTPNYITNATDPPLKFWRPNGIYSLRR